MPTIAATGKALRIQVCSVAEKPRLGRYAKINGNHAPQMKNSRTIIRSNRYFADSCINSKLKSYNHTQSPTADRFLPSVDAYESERQAESRRSNVQIRVRHRQLFPRIIGRTGRCS